MSAHVGEAGDDRVDEPTLAAIARCYGGGIPAVLCTASADGVPNITYLSRAHQVDDTRIALSNQFMSKTARNLAVNPAASLLLLDPVDHAEYRLALRYERTERRGPLFERLRADIDGLAALTGMQDVFRLRAADIFQVEGIEQVGTAQPTPGDARDPAVVVDALARFATWIDRATDLDVVIDTALDGLERLFGYRHVSLLLVDEGGDRLYSIASRGFESENVGAEVEFGEGQIGLAAVRCEIQRFTGLRQLAKYSRTVRASYEAEGVPAGREIPMPGLPDAESRILVPVRALGSLVGMLVAESRAPAAFDVTDEQVLGVAATIVGNALEHARQLGAGGPPAPPDGPSEGTRAAPDRPGGTDAVAFRFFDTDGSVFVGGEYLIKGVAGRILRRLLADHLENGRTEFTNRELRLDPTLELPDFKQNLESRLILLRRRLDERQVPVRIVRSGRGRLHLAVSAPISLDIVETAPPP